uniref:DNA/RNA-binding protein Alba-like domain-containing protein n=1 Tax=Panagrolaimus sp. PS1159 TaxID=55785 RepID=A0AC35GF32_9BILA
MNIKKNSKASNIVKFVINELKKDETKQILFHGELEACEKVVTHVEIVKREFLPQTLYQWTRIDGRIDETSGKRISFLEILLSKEEFEIKVDGQQCSTDENIGAALPPPKKTVPAMPIKRMQYGGSNGKPTSKNKSTVEFADTLLPIIKPRQFESCQSKKGKRKGEEEINPFARPKKRPHSKTAESKDKKEND